MPTRPPSLLAVVEDNAGLRDDLVEFLQLKGFAVRGFDSAEAFFRAWPAVRFDLLVLDVGLPGASGLEIARRVRARDTAGVVMLTSLDTNEDQVAGLSAGADIYLSKHSSLEVIEAACHSVLRRLGSGAASSGPARGEAWRLDALHRRLEAPDGAAVDLTHDEALILSALFHAPGEAISREQLLARLGKPDTPSNIRNLDNAASRLRRKVQQACGLELPLRPAYGKGYTFSGVCEVVT
jgi:DNA-binding response OmpR family regulator